jgi:hypothetical protein
MVEGYGLDSEHGRETGCFEHVKEYLGFVFSLSELLAKYFGLQSQAIS